MEAITFTAFRVRVSRAGQIGVGAKGHRETLGFNMQTGDAPKEASRRFR